MLFTDRAAHPKVLLPSLLHCPTVPLRVRVQLSAPRKGPKATCCADGGAPVCSTPRGSRARGDRGGGQRACRQHEQRGQGAGLQQARAQGQPRRLQAHHPQDAADARRLPAALHQQSLHHSWPRCVHALKRVAPTTLKVIHHAGMLQYGQREDSVYQCTSTWQLADSVNVERTVLRSSVFRLRESGVALMRIALDNTKLFCL